MPAIAHETGVVVPTRFRVGPDCREENPEDEGGSTKLGQLIETTEEELLADCQSAAHQKGDHRLNHHRGDGEHLRKVADIGLAVGP